MTTKVEIEIKYRIADFSTVRELLAAKRLGPYEIDDFSSRQHHDIYFDTPDRLFMSIGYAYRFRRTATRGIVQLKSFNKGRGYVQRRTELWSVTDYPEDPHTWDAGPAKDIVMDTLQNTSLQTLFEIRQLRHYANLISMSEIMAEISIDEVVWQTGGETTKDWELEIELGADDNNALLNFIDEELVQTGRLIPQMQSKFERGLAMMKMSLPDSSLVDEKISKN